MILDQNDNLAIVTQDQLSVIELVNKIESIYPKLKNDNIIVHLTSISKLNKQDIVAFLNISKTHRSKKYSFVVVSNTIDLELVPDDLIVVPTLQEAHDIIEMEEMERDLGF